MKREIISSVVVFALMFSGCAGSETGTDTTATVATETQQTDTAPQAPMDPDTDMSAEGKTDTNISADNKVGREMNILAMLRENPNLSTLVDLIRAADLVVTLESPAPYTLFAPTNEAFAALPAGTLEALKQSGNKYELTKLLQAHILPNRITAVEMKDSMPMKTAQGEEVIVKRNGENLQVGGANVIMTDVSASNGVIHVVDKVLVPPKR